MLAQPLGSRGRRGARLEFLPGTLPRGRECGQGECEQVAAPLVKSFGGYPTLYMGTAVVMVVAGYLVRFIKSVP